MRQQQQEQNKNEPPLGGGTPTRPVLKTVVSRFGFSITV